MDSTGSVVRIVVVEPVELGGRAGASATARRLEASDGGATLAVLERLGSEVELEIVPDAAGCLTATRSRPVDLVVLDRVDRPDVSVVLDALFAAGPPVILVTDEVDEAVALEAFRGGAADCVRVGPDFDEVLSVVVLEQLRKWRKQKERGQAARRIRELQRYNDNIIQNLNSALLVVGPDGVILTANATAEEILGAADLEGRLVWDWLADESRDESVIGRTLQNGIRFKGAETLICRDDGTVLPIGISCSPLVVEPEAVGDEDPVRRGAVAIFQDLSEIKQLQRQVLQTEKLASIGQLAAGVAHEINNPMGFIHANLFQMTEYLGDLRRAWQHVDDLQKAVHGGDLDEIRAASGRLEASAREIDLEFVQTDFAKAVRESQEGAERIRHIVQDLREYSRQDTEECVEADINHCVDSTASIAWTMMKHSVVLEKAYADLPKVRCFPMQLKQVFMNLLVNAYQAIEQKVGSSGAVGQIQIRSERRGDYVVIAIRDTGVGIEPANLNRIFDPFFTTKDVGSGTGLGLANSHSIVQRHAGRIEVSSEPGKGATFSVCLPVAGPDEG